MFGARESYGAVYARVLAPMGLDLSVEAFDAGIRQSWRVLEQIVPRGVDRYAYFPGGEEEYWLRFAQGAIESASGGPIEDGFVERVLQPLRAAFRIPGAWKVFPDVVPVLEALHRDGIRLGVVSNWDSRLPYLLDILGLDGYFDAVSVSHLVGCEKPAPEIFEHALRELGADPSVTVHVGDVPEIDLEGAKAAGLDGLLVDRRGRLDPSLGALPDLSPLPGLARDGPG